MDFETQKRADGIIAQSALTNSKRPASFVEGVYPTHLVSAHGVNVTDTAGNKYVDFVCSLGTNLLGYSQEKLSAVVNKAYRNGCTFSLSSVQEITLGEKIREILPFAERVKILKTGSEGCTAAVRIARAYTGRKIILTQGYGGWHDEFISMQPPALGVTNTFNIGKLVTLEDITSDTAAVILEPIITDWSLERVEWLKSLRERCTKTGTILIFDETITALRFPNYTVSGWTGIRPDMIILGKALGGGLPLCVVAGLEAIMNCGEYFVSSTFSGETVSISVAIELLGLLQKEFDLNRLWSQGMMFQKKFNELFSTVKIEGYPTRGVLQAPPLEKAIFMQEAVKGGLLFGSSWFYAFPHIEQTDEIFSTLKEVAMKIKSTTVVLEGQMPKSPFAQQLREKT